MSRVQRLVGAQVEVNRAVFAMNVAEGGYPPDQRPDIDCSDEAIAAYIRRAIEDLTESLNGYSRPRSAMESRNPS